MADASAPRQIFRRLFRNWLSWAGIVLSASALFAFLCSSRSISSLVIAILTFAFSPTFAPGFFILGIVLIAIGVVLRWRARASGCARKPPSFSRLIYRGRGIGKYFAVFAGCSVAFLFLTAFGNYQTYQYTESVQFCGRTCHLPMEPEFLASEHTAHAKVECVTCHVGPGAAAYFKTKLNGVKQLYHTVGNDFERPTTSCGQPASSAGDLRAVPLAKEIRR